MTYNFLPLSFVLQKHFSIPSSSFGIHRMTLFFPDVSPLCVKRNCISLGITIITHLCSDCHAFGKCFRKRLCTPQQAWHKNPAPQCSLPPWRYSLSPLRQASCSDDCHFFMYSLWFKPVCCHLQKDWTWHANIKIKGLNNTKLCNDKALIFLFKLSGFWRQPIGMYLYLNKVGFF